MFNLKVTLSVFLESYPKLNFCGAAILYLKLVGLIVTDGTDIGTSDQTVNAIYTAANGNGATGAATVTILYIQNNNLA